MERFVIFFPFRLSELITTLTCVLMDNFCPCYLLIREMKITEIKLFVMLLFSVHVYLYKSK